MRKILPLTTIAVLLVSLAILSGCGDQSADKNEAGQQEAAMTNPFFQTWETPFGTPPFDLIKNEHYEPAIIKGMALHQDEIAAIIANKDEATFANTIEAIDASGADLARVRRVFGAMNGAMISPELQEISKKLAPLSSKHRDSILLNDALYQKVAAVHAQLSSLGLNREQEMLLEETYKGFVRGGANLSPEDKTKVETINGELALLTLQFGENVLGDTNEFSLTIDNKADLAGLSKGSIAAAAEAATEAGHEGSWTFTIHKPSLIPFLQYSENRAARKVMFEAYINQGNNAGDRNNNDILKKIASLRLQRAKLMGFASHAHYTLDNNMAKTPDAVYGLLDKIWPAAIAKAGEEADEFQRMIDAEGGDFTLEPWDWWYYAEKVKKERYNLDEEMLRPYFELNNVRTGLFEVANKLYGLTFSERTDITVYHEDVQAFEVKDSAGDHLAVLYVDYFPRASKRGGAWMDAFRKQHFVDGKDVRPVIYNVGNFTKPTADSPSLLSVDEVGTMYHEFGHALHGMLSQCTYNRLSGTSVAHDYVELPSQIMENWAFQPEVLQMYAKHYQTGEIIPEDLINKLEASSHFNQGFATTEYVAASYLDMDWHTITEDVEGDPLAFENEKLGQRDLPDAIVARYRSPYFRHVFAGGYSAGYYAYIWAEVLDADGFQAFKGAGDIFDPKTAADFKKYVLEAGGTDDPMVLYKKFRGKDPAIEPLLKKRGLL